VALSQAELARARDGVDALRLEVEARLKGEDPDERLDFVLDALVDAMDEMGR
jgi:hypothetical protein